MPRRRAPSIAPRAIEEPSAEVIASEVVEDEEEDAVDLAEVDPEVSAKAKAKALEKREKKLKEKKAKAALEGALPKDDDEVGRGDPGRRRASERARVFPLVYVTSC